MKKIPESIFNPRLKSNLMSFVQYRSPNTDFDAQLSKIVASGKITGFIMIQIPRGINRNHKWNQIIRKIKGAVKVLDHPLIGLACLFQKFIFSQITNI